MKEKSDCFDCKHPDLEVQTAKMLSTSLLLVALATLGLAAPPAPPAGYKTVYITSLQDTKFVITPKASKNGSTTVVFVPFVSPPNNFSNKLMKQSNLDEEARATMVYPPRKHDDSIGGYEFVLRWRS